MASKLQLDIETVQAGRRAAGRLGKLVREYRDRAGLTQAELARRLKIAPSFLCDIELGRRGLGPRKLAELARLVDGGQR